MTDRIRPLAYIVGGAALALVGYGIYRLLKWGGDEDRPLIRVRNGSMVFSIDPTSSGTHLDWVSKGGGWRPDHPNGRPVAEFEVTFTGSGASSCSTLRGVMVTIEYGAQKIRVLRAGPQEPHVEPGSLLRHESTTRTLHHGTSGSGMITRVEVRPSGQSCTFTSTDVEVIVRPLH